MVIAVLSDIHGNLEAFQSVLADMDAQVPPPAEILSLGDNLGYGPDPEACVQLVRERGIHSVMGNHELGVARSKYRSWFNSQSREALQRTCELVSPETVDYIAGLPMALSKHDALFVHGLPPDSALKYLYELDSKQIQALFGTFNESIAFIGHTHELELVELEPDGIFRRPLVEGLHCLDRNTRYIVNIGAVGQPRDGDRRAKYVLWDTETWELQVRFIKYDVQTTVKKFKEAGMPQRYAERLL
ncbi:metallophosphoesterase [Desulfovibrio subterraneus]|uniref:Serine/threonine protein phosphatase n=1 Tax=Desulfovibrio subterraneus TaxID=2718620 RepID=A0A7J0BGB8_9BACT|nr:metallophosphoesterase family protein [Desulfovibrio subterraneus]WBF66855.1 metallophosphoesterase [Desulfovibrio subterraneus]GFM32578.1 serine/threonine protein phosphatase [Desulfovibrio subterraneus]